MSKTSGIKNSNFANFTPEVKARKLAQELEWSDQHAKRERRYVDNHDRILAADMDRSSAGGYAAHRLKLEY